MHDFLEKYIEEDPFLKDIFYFKVLKPRAYCYEQIDKLSNAIEDYDKILEQYSENEQILVARSKCYEILYSRESKEEVENLEEKMSFLTHCIEDLRKLIYLKKDPDGKFRQKALKIEEYIKNLELKITNIKSLKQNAEKSHNSQVVQNQDLGDNKANMKGKKFKYRYFKILRLR